MHTSFLICQAYICAVICAKCSTKPKFGLHYSQQSPVKCVGLVLYGIQIQELLKW